MTKKRRARRAASERFCIPDDLYEYLRAPEPRSGRPPLRDEVPIVVTDDWPEVVPITEAELQVMESHFAEELDEIFGPRA